ncbi:hypothetical protein Z517_01598 [Fonsecaea pedrosoi CBS 271.37]|uniref:Oxidase ustYa n=1 Tax=Fonsecaea pedrosoi CBS 271.37 TaxID=1442368 RepID=A0A0D2GYR1_9EURO|nr:uncharacterized protein Z517_01598 [Fonsecaea pedrosoi CBS 271.37]KIW86203.1 hypothetical protein Z517_01598 [Fonsecaea pedrosoi CBS 271.37]
MFDHDWWSWPATRHYTYRYNLLDADKEEASFDEGRPDIHNSRQPRHRAYCRGSSTVLKLILATLVTASACVLAFYAGTIYEYQRNTKWSSGDGGPLQLRTIEFELEYNASFGDAPSPVTEAAWDDLLPVQGGFFQHPQIAPSRSDFAVFHQLHCLNGIRQAYWFTHAVATGAATLSASADGPDADMSEMISPRHISHCVDLLRQALMCQPDLTVEVKDERGGVTGFGTVHQCKDWAQLMAWMAEWETYGQTDEEAYEAGERHRHHHHHDHLGHV